MDNIAKKISSFSVKEISQFFAQAKAVKKSQEMVILAAPAFCAYGRILLIASRKSGNAVQRNKLKRQCKAIFYEERLFSNPVNLAIIFKPEAKKLSFQEIKGQLVAAHTKALELYDFKKSE